MKDWPLGLCDVRTLDAERDLAQATILHADHVNHNCQLHYNSNQTWYYLGDHDPEELIIFRQYDSCLEGNNGTKSPLNLYMLAAAD